MLVEILLDRTAFLFLRAEGRDHIRLRIDQKDRIVLRTQSLDDLSLHLHLIRLLQLSAHLFIHIAHSQNKGHISRLIHLIIADLSVHFALETKLM